MIDVNIIQNNIKRILQEEKKNRYSDWSKEINFIFSQEYDDNDAIKERIKYNLMFYMIPDIYVINKEFIRNNSKSNSFLYLLFSRDPISKNLIEEMKNTKQKLLIYNKILSTGGFSDGRIGIVEDIIRNNLLLKNTKFDPFFFSFHHHLPEKFIEVNQDVLDWGLISQYQILSEDFIRNHESHLHMPSLFIREEIMRNMSDSFLAEYHDQIEEAKKSSEYEVVFESDIEKFIDEGKSINWDFLCCVKPLSDLFVKKYRNYINMDLINAFKM